MAMASSLDEERNVSSDVWWCVDITAVGNDCGTLL
jgi:hypothetical protein